MLGRTLYAVSDDEEFARASGLPVLAVNVVLAVLVAATVVLSMRVVGPAADQRADGGAGGAGASWSPGASPRPWSSPASPGWCASVAGTTLSFYADTPSGGTIVLLAVLAFARDRGRHRSAAGRLRALAAPTPARQRRSGTATTSTTASTSTGSPAASTLPCRTADHVDYVHDGHRHAPRLTRHGVGYDEH